MGIELEKIDGSLVRRIPRELARRHHAIPVALEGDVLTVAVASPLAEWSVHDLELFTGLKIATVRVSDEQLRCALMQHYPTDAPVEQGTMPGRAAVPKQVAAGVPTPSVTEIDKYTRLHAVAVRLWIWCDHCSTENAVRSLAGHVRCAHCEHPLDLAKIVELGIDVREKALQLLMWTETKKVDVHDQIEGGCRFEAGLSLERPACACGRPVPEWENLLAGGSTQGDVACHHCGARLLTRALSTGHSPSASGLKWLLGTLPTASAAPRTEAITLRCSNCGATLQAEGTTRIVECTYCHASEEIPEELWKRKPRQAPVPFYFVLLPSLTLVLEQHYRDLPDEVRIRDAQEPSTAPQVLAFLVQAGVPKNIRELVGGNPGAPKELRIEPAVSPVGRAQTGASARHPKGIASERAGTPPNAGAGQAPHIADGNEAPSSPGKSAMRRSSLLIAGAVAVAVLVALYVFRG